MYRSLITSFLLAFTISAFSQATKSELLTIDLPTGSKQDKRILSTAAARTLLQMKADENAITLGDKVEVFSLPASATKQTEADVKLILQKAGWETHSFSTEPAYVILKNNNRSVLMYLESLKKETALYVMPVTSMKEEAATAVAVVAAVPEVKPVQSQTEIKPQVTAQTEVKVQPQVNTAPVVETKPHENLTPPDNTFTFTTINFDDGWTSVVASDYVKTTKANIQVFIYYSFPITDQMRDSNLEFSDQFWNLLVVPNYSVKSAVRLQEGVTYFRTYFIEGEAIDPRTNKPCYLGLNVLVNNGVATPVLAMAPDKNSYYQQFPEPKKLGEMTNYNKFAITAKDIVGEWTYNSSSAVSLYNTYTGNYAGMNSTQSTDTFVFHADGTYSSKHAGASSVYGTNTVYTQEYKGKLTATNWDLTLTNRFKDATENFNAQFEVVRGGRILHLQNKSATGIWYHLVRSK
jgi:hypothetical protein